MKDIVQKEVLLGVTGGIAAYKAAEIVRSLQKQDCSVTVVMTESAKQFITPLTFEALTGRQVYSGLFDSQSPSAMEHIELSKKTDLLLIAPATANIIGKAASGVADDLLTSLLLTITKPVIIAPAMNVNMYLNSVVQENITRLKNRGVIIVGPGEGELACGDEGPGRLDEIENIVDAVQLELETSENFKGKKVLVTAGRTQEFIDPVRYISNPSSGKMGFALANEVYRQGAEVTLVSGPTDQVCLHGIKFVPVVTAIEMKEEVFKYFPDVDIIIMAAAVGDYLPVRYSKQKIKKENERLVIEFKKGVDILAELGKKKENKVLVGFAAETECLMENARKKLQGKNLDMIVANDVGSGEGGFQSDFNKALILTSEGKLEDVPLNSKTNLAKHILEMLHSYCVPTSNIVRKLTRIK